MDNNSSYKHSTLTELIIGTFYDVYNELGYAFSNRCIAIPSSLLFWPKELRLNKRYQSQSISGVRTLATSGLI
jgi:hypothetical protein